MQDVAKDEKDIGASYNPDYVRGFRAALRYLIATADAPGDGLKKAKVLGKRTLEWLKVVEEFTFDIADGHDIELWITPDGKLFGRKERR